MSFQDTRDLLRAVGFQVRLLIEVDVNAFPVTCAVRRGGLVHGFLRDGEPTGYVIDDDAVFPLPNVAHPRRTSHFVTMSADGFLRLEFAGRDVQTSAQFDAWEWRYEAGMSPRGLRNPPPDVPWGHLPANAALGLPARAIVGKVFGDQGSYTGAVACDDLFWVWFGGEFPA